MDLRSVAVEASCFTALLNIDRSIISSLATSDFGGQVSDESEFNREQQCPWLVLNRSGELTGTPKGFALSGLFVKSFKRNGRWRLCCMALKCLLGGEGWLG